jgi:hypothetical protein
MDAGAAVMSGIVGVAVTMIIHNMLPFFGLPRVNLPGVLGTWLLDPGTRAAIVGMLLHFAFGALFGLVYAAIWAFGVGDASYQWGVMFGAAHGLIVAAVIPALLHRYPRPDEMLDGPSTMVALFILHVIYGLVVALQYRAFVD